MIKANKSKSNSSGALLNISRFTGGGITPLVMADNRMIRRMKGERGRTNGTNYATAKINASRTAGR